VDNCSNTFSVLPPWVGKLMLGFNLIPMVIYLTDPQGLNLPYMPYFLILKDLLFFLKFILLTLQPTKVSDMHNYI